MISRKPKFITFEGGEGSGKSTQSKKLHEYLLSKNIKSIWTKEPGGTKEAERIREVLLYSELLPASELMLVMSARYEHINKVIVPALLDGAWVICDRFIDSSACYQSGDSGLTIYDIYELHSNLMKIENVKMANEFLNIFGTSEIMPDLTFFMDIPPETALNRAFVRGDVTKFEQKNLNFHRKIYDNFKKICNLHKDRVLQIDCADKAVEDIHQLVISNL